MFRVNEYFDGRVKSLSFNDKEGDSSIGVMAPGEYVFGTSTVEYMTVTSGKMKVILPGSEEYKEFNSGETFKVEKDTKFTAKVDDQVSYLCKYR